MKWKASFAYLFFFLLITTTAKTQNADKIKQLEEQLAKATEDSARVLHLHDLFLQYRDYDSSKAMQFADKAIALSKSAGFKKGESLVLLNKGIFLNLNGDNEAGENLINQSLQIKKQTNDFAGQGYCLRSLGNILYDKNEYDKALQLYLQAAEVFEKAKDQKGLSGTYIWIGNVFNEGLRQFDKAVDYFSKSLTIAKKINDSSLISYNYNNLGQAYYYSKKYPEALNYYQQSKEIKHALGDIRGLGNAYNNISNVYFDQENYRKAVLYNDSSLAIREQQSDKKGIATSYLNAGNIYLKLKDYDNAFQQYQKAISIGNEIDFKEPIIESYNGLSSYYEAKGNTSEALNYYKKYKALNDSIYNSSISEQINTLQTKYETEKKSQQIKEQQFEITRRNYWIIGIATTLLLLILLFTSYYRRYQLKQKAKLQAAILKQQEIATKAVIEAEENERQRIARDLHDGIGQMMSAAKMNLSAFESDLQLKDPEQQQSFDKIIGLVDESCKELRSVSHNMMPNALLKNSLASAIRDFIDKMDKKALQVQLYTEGLDERLDANVETVLYRVIQECVNNVIKHAGADTLDISVIRDKDGISATIEDNGKGFDSNNKANFEGIGLKNIITRVEYLKGTVEFDSTIGKGTLVALNVPLESVI